MEGPLLNHVPAGMGLELILPRDRGRKPYWLHARFSTPAYPKPEWVDELADAAGKLFIADMNRQGWQFEDKHGLWWTGPLQPTPVTGAPTRAQREYFRAKDALSRVQQGDKMRARELDYVASVPLLNESETWEYDLKGVFIHDTILVETPDPHEELAMLRNR